MPLKISTRTPDLSSTNDTMRWSAERMVILANGDDARLRSFLTHSALESDDDDGDEDGDERKAVCATKVVFEATSFA